MATHSSILAWKIPWTEEPDELQSMGLQRVRHKLVTNKHHPRSIPASEVLLLSLYPGPSSLSLPFATWSLSP